MHRPLRLSVALFALSLSALAASCNPIGDLTGQNGPPPRVFQIASSPSTQQSFALETPAVVFVEEPTLSGFLESERIPVERANGEIQYVGGVRWAERPSRLIRRTIQEQLGQVEGLTPLGRGALDVPADYRLKLRITAFNLTDQAGQTAQASLEAFLIDANGTLMATRIFSAEQAASPALAAEAAGALSATLTRSAAALAQWLTQTLNAETISISR